MKTEEEKQKDTVLGLKIMGVIAIVIVGYYIFSGGSSSSTRSNSSSPPNNSTTTSQMHDCPHCGGSGNRRNNITGEYGKCSSCNGAGRVTQDEYDHMSK